MAHYKHDDHGQTRMIAVSYEQQILPGSFKFTLHHLIDNDVDPSVFETRYHNDASGAPAYDSAILLKIMLYAYSKGITSSRKIECLFDFTGCCWTGAWCREWESNPHGVSPTRF